MFVESLNKNGDMYNTNLALIRQFPLENELQSEMLFESG